MNKIYRQGDVMLIGSALDLTHYPRLEKLPDDAKALSPTAGRVILALGSSTGHAHAFSAAQATLYQWGDERLLVTEEGAVLQHEEHTHLLIDQGLYRVVIQKQYTPEEIQQVED